MTLGPDYNPTAWRLGYQFRQFGVAGPSAAESACAYYALSNPPAAMTTAINLAVTHPHLEPTE